MEPTPDRNHGPLYGLIIATTLGLAGRQLSVIAIPWFVLSTTGSASRAGVVAAAVLVPGLIAGLLGGVLVDRLGYRQVSVASDLVAAVATMLIPLLYATIGLAFWQLLVLVFFSSLLDVPAITARRSMVPELARAAGMPLDRVNAMLESLQNLSMLIGMPLAGLLIAWMGARHVLWIDAAASALSALIVVLTVPTAMFVRHIASGSTHYWDDVLTGLRFIRRDQVLWPMVIVLALSNAISSSTAVTIPFFFQTEFGSAASIGLVYAAMGGGAFLGATVYGVVAGRISRRVIWYVSFLVVPLECWIFLASPPVALLAAVFFVVGFVMGPINPIMVSLRHERSPLSIRGRVFSTYSAIAMAAQPLGVLAAGNLIDAIGFDPTILLFAILAQLLGIASLTIPGFRHLDDAPREIPGGATPAEPAPAR
jgi:predicted MFS family arabinose efflux permease